MQWFNDTEIQQKIRVIYQRRDTLKALTHAQRIIAARYVGKHRRTYCSTLALMKLDRIKRKFKENIK